MSGEVKKEKTWEEVWIATGGDLHLRLLLNSHVSLEPELLLSC